MKEASLADATTQTRQTTFGNRINKPAISFSFDSYWQFVRCHNDTPRHTQSSHIIVIMYILALCAYTHKEQSSSEQNTISCLVNMHYARFRTTWNTCWMNVPQCGAKSTVSSLSKRQREREIISQRAQERQDCTCGLYFRTQTKNGLDLWWIWSYLANGTYILKFMVWYKQQLDSIALLFEQ